MNIPVMPLSTLLSGSSGEDFFNDTQTAQKLFRNSLDLQWEQYIGTDNSHPIWLISYRIGSVIAIMILMFFLVNIMIKLFQNNFLMTDLTMLIKPLIVAALLASNAAGVGYLAKGMRYTGQVVNFWVIDFYEVFNDQSQEFAQANQHLSNKQVRDAVNKAAVSCSNLFKDVGTYKACMINDLERQRDAAQADIHFGNRVGNFLTAVNNNTIDLAKYTLSSATLADERIKLFANAISFNVTADLALFYTALYGPIAISTSMLPVAANSLIAWLSAFYFIQFTQVSYTIMISILADILNNGEGITSYIYATLLGFIIPTVAILFGAGGGMTLYSSLNGMGLGAAGEFNLGALTSRLLPKTIKR